MIQVVITTRNRPMNLLSLLWDLEEQAKDRDITVAVFDDASTCDLSEASAVIARNGWSLIVAPEHRGREGYWQTTNEIFAHLRQFPWDYVIKFDDDFRLCSDFFNRAISTWESIQDPHKVSLNPLCESVRDGHPCWTDISPIRRGDVVETGWVDGSYIAEHPFFETLGWTLQPTIPRRNRGSGVGEQISKRLIAAGKSLYQVHRSLVVHAHGISQMNGALRIASPMETVRFIDGDEARAHLERESIIASLASIPERATLLERTVASLLPQVDRLNVYLNGYPDIPECLHRPRICVARSQDHGDNGDAGKFWWADKLGSCFHLVCDDDLIYPSDYVTRMVRAIEDGGRRAVVGLHGVTLSEPFVSYYRSRIVRHNMADVEGDEWVHLVATSTCAYHTDTLRVSPGDFLAPNMADVWFGLLCQRQRVPVLALGHRRGWIGYQREADATSIFQSAKLGDGSWRDTGQRQTQEIQRTWPWTIHRSPSPPASPSRLRPKPSGPVDMICSHSYLSRHLAPIWSALPSAIRGQILDTHALSLKDRTGYVLCASFHDLRAVAEAGRRAILVSHGAGQTYGKPHPAHAGGPGRDHVDLYLAPGPSPAEAHRRAYPHAQVVEVGCPAMDPWIGRGVRNHPTGHQPPTVAVSFRAEQGRGLPEWSGCPTHWTPGLPALAERYKVLGHGHPDADPHVRRECSRLGIEWVADVDEVYRRADVLMADNTSILWEWLLLDRPLVLLECPTWRPEVAYGLRFSRWAATLGPTVWGPSEAPEAVSEALRDPPHYRIARKRALPRVYSVRDGTSTRRAAEAISHLVSQDWPS